MTILIYNRKCNFIINGTGQQDNIMNYNNFFGLNDKPFRQSPDTDYFFGSTVHKELMQHLYYCLESDDAFVEITGEPGIGKSITVRTFLNQIAGDKIKLSLIINPKITPQDLLVHIALDCDMDESIFEQYTGEKLFRLFYEHLKNLNNNNIVPIVVIDDAHSLSNDALEQLSLISNFETEKKHLIKVILIGQPILRQRLQTPVLQKIDNRISIRYHLAPLTKYDVASYIYHRLGIASESGSAPSLFSEQTVNQIYKYSQGVPRQINILCERTLMAAFTENTREIGSDHVKKAFRSFQDNKRSSHVIKKRICVVSVALIFLMACIYLISGISDKSEVTIEKSLPKPIEQPKSNTTVDNSVAITQSTHSKIKTTPKQKISESLAPDKQKKTEFPEKQKIDQPGSQLIQSSQYLSLNKLPIKSLFTKNSYFIVLSPDINRMVVWQGKPDFIGLTGTHSGSFQIEEGAYVLENEKMYTATSIDSLTTPHRVESNSIQFAQNLTNTLETSFHDNPKPITLNQTKPSIPKELTNTRTLTKKGASPQKEKLFNSQALPAKHDVSFQKGLTRTTDDRRLHIKDETHQSQQSPPPKVSSQPPRPTNESDRIEKPNNTNALSSGKKGAMHHTILSLPSDKRLAMISLDVKQLNVLKGVNGQPNLIKQAQISVNLPEGIYILSRYKNKPVLFHPDHYKFQTTLADELWQKIDPITNVIPVIAYRSHQANKTGSHFQTLLSFVKQWEAAWHQKDIDAYMQLYVKDLIYFYKLNAPPIKLNWKILKSSQSRVFSGNPKKIMEIFPTTYLIDPVNSKHALALFNQTYTDTNYSEIGVMALYLKYTKNVWKIYGRLRIY
jgi:type II secretory pathway predicted ATPase ExeA